MVAEYKQAKANVQEIPSMKQALLDPRYKWATYFCMGFVIFNQFGGANAIVLYSTEIIDTINDSNGTDISSVLISFLISIT